MAKAFVIKHETRQTALKSRARIQYGEAHMDVDALWDTGATNSCISMDVVTGLSLVPTGFLPMQTPSGHRNAGTYWVDILLPHDVLVEKLQVCDSEIGNQGIGLLIGMDIISQGDLAVSNYKGRTVFSFRTPSECELDFVAGLRLAGAIGAPHRTRYNSHHKPRKNK